MSRRLLLLSLQIHTNSVATETVAGLLPKRTRQSAEISGKLGAKVVESNEISVLEKCGIRNPRTEVPANWTLFGPAFSY